MAVLAMEAIGVERRGDRVTAVRGPDDDRALRRRGAGRGRLVGAGPVAGSTPSCPVTPTKGQIVHVVLPGADASGGDRPPTDRWPIVQPILNFYLVPWPGGRVACGGTFEADAGFDVRPTAAGMRDLLRECVAIAPGLGEATFAEVRVGLRPDEPRRPTAAGPGAGLRQRPRLHRARRQRAAARPVLRRVGGRRRHRTRRRGRAPLRRVPLRARPDGASGERHRRGVPALGDELDPCPNRLQEPLARVLVKAGADIVVGAHAHVLLGGGYLGSAYVDYGLGNFAFYDNAAPENHSGSLVITATGRPIDAVTWRPAVIVDDLPQPLTGTAGAGARGQWVAARACTDVSSAPSAPIATAGTESSPAPAAAMQRLTVGQRLTALAPVRAHRSSTRCVSPPRPNGRGRRSGWPASGARTRCVSAGPR